MAGNQRIVSERNKSETQKINQSQIDRFCRVAAVGGGPSLFKNNSFDDGRCVRTFSWFLSREKLERIRCFHVFRLTAIQLLLADDVQWSDQSWARLNSIKRFIRGSRVNPAIELLFSAHFYLEPTNNSFFRGEKYEKKINLHPTAKDKGGVSGTRNWIFSHHFCPERLETCSQNRPVRPSNNWIFIFLCDVFAFYISRKKSSRLPFLVFLHLPAVKEQRPINMASRDAS